MAKSYLRLDDRRDPKWAYPGGTKENWNAPTIATFFADVMAPGLTPEEVEMGRSMFEGAFESMLAGAKLPEEVENDGTWAEAYATGCPEEPDAPPVRLLLRIPNNNTREKFPVVMYFFAAGMGGKPEYFAAEIASISKQLNCIVVAPQYRFHPENKQPKQLNDLHASYLWIAENADTYKMDADNVILSGYSIGGQMALGLAYRLKENGVCVRGVSALFPPCDDRGGGASSYITFGGENLGCEEVQMTWTSFFGTDRIALSALSPEIVPGHATVEELKGMPPIFMHAAESDPNRDDDITYCSKLLEAGVMCSLHVWPGVNHATFYSGAPHELKDRFLAEVLQNMSDMVNYDLRRPWNK
jgi:acetyl esterase/lipase